jgi:hypothetical protein
MLLRFAALVSVRQCTRMPLVILGVSIAEPPTAPHTSYGRRIVARLIVSRHGLLAFALYFAIGSCALATTRH